MRNKGTADRVRRITDNRAHFRLVKLQSSKRNRRQFIEQADDAAQIVAVVELTTALCATRGRTGGGFQIEDIVMRAVQLRDDNAPGDNHTVCQRDVWQVVHIRRKIM